MIDRIISIPGPTFLVYYFIYAIVVIVLTKLVSQYDYTSNKDIPEPTSLTPLELAILRKGYKGALISTFFNLWHKKIVSIEKSNRSLVIQQISNNTSHLNVLEKTICNYLVKPRYYRQFFTKNSQKTINELLVPNMETLFRLELIPNERIRKHIWRSFNTGIFLLIGFGGIKLYFGVVREKPVTLLILLMAISIIMLYLTIRPSQVTNSSLGRKLLKQAKTRFEYLKNSKNNSNLLTDKNLLYGVAVLGVSKFISGEIGSILKNPSLLEQTARSTSSIHGCSSCGDGCGGGGCSSGCGGGCGGCGGD